MEVSKEEIFFGVIRAGIWRRPVEVEIPDGYDWTGVLQMLREQVMTGLAASTIMQLPEAKRRLTGEQLQTLLSDYGKLMSAREKIQKTIITIFDELEGQGIKPMLMKGESMVRFYPQECQRGIGDIDVLVPQERYLEAVRIRQKLSGDLGHEDAMERHYKIEYGGFTIEIHQRPVWCANGAHSKDFRSLSEKYADPDRCEWILLGHGDRVLDPGVGQGDLSPRPIRVFPMQYNVLFIFNHLLEHLRDGGIGFKQMVDWGMMMGPSKSPLKGDFSSDHELHDFNQQVLEQELRESGLLRAWKVMGGILVKELGLPKESFPLYDEGLAEKSQGEILRRMIAGGDFGWKLYQQGNTERFAPLRVLKNVAFVIKDTRYLWTLFPMGAICSSWGIVLNSLRNHAGKAKGNRVF